MSLNVALTILFCGIIIIPILVINLITKKHIPKDVHIEKIKERDNTDA